MICRLKMRNDLLSMKDDSGLYSLMIKVEILGTSCIMCAHAFGGYPYSITRVWMRTSNGKTTIVMFA